MAVVVGGHHPTIARAEDTDELVEEVVALRGGDVRLLRPRDLDAMLIEEAFDHEELLPYWAELWPSGVALARAVGVRALRGARTVELGCGLGLASIAAARAGGRVLATDWSPAAIARVATNARRNDVALDTMVVDWTDAAPLVRRGPWDLVLGADILYEQRTVPVLLDLLPRLVAPGGQVWIGDPGRAAAQAFLAEADATWEISSRPDAQHAPAVVHVLRRR